MLFRNRNKVTSRDRTNEIQVQESSDKWDIKFLCSKLKHGICQIMVHHTLTITDIKVPFLVFNFFFF